MQEGLDLLTLLLMYVKVEIVSWEWWDLICMSKAGDIGFKQTLSRAHTRAEPNQCRVEVSIRRAPNETRGSEKREAERPAGKQSSN
jgi:hypothetical protein